MSRTIAWSNRVNQTWTHRDGSHDVEVVGEHPRAGLVKLRRAGLETEWVPSEEFEAEYVQVCCGECGQPKSYVKAVPGEYCTKPCCWPRRAPGTC